MKKELLVTLEEFEEAEKYWLAKLAGQLKEIKLPDDFPRTKQYKAAQFKWELEHDLTGKLEEISKNNDLALFVILLTAFKILLYKFSDQNDIITASPVYTAENREYNQYVVFRDIVLPGFTFKELLMKVKDTVVQGYKNEYYPIKNLMELLEVKDYSLLFNNTLLLENIHKKELIEEMSGEFGSGICLTAGKSPGKLEGSIIYNSALFHEDTIRCLSSAYIRILTQVLNQTGIRISRIELLTPGEKHQILFTFNHTQRDFPQNKTVVELFKRQVEKKPRRAAVRSTIDLSDIFDDPGLTPGQENMNGAPTGKIRNCCFKKNQYIYQSDLESGGKKNGYTILKTHHHNSVVVNRNMLKLIDCFDGENNTAAIFTGIKDKKLRLLLYPVHTEDILEIVLKFGKKEDIVLNGSFADFVGLVKLLYHHHLIEPEAVNANPPGVRDSFQAQWQREQEEVPGDMDLPLSNELLEQDKELSPAHVLLLGDTPGMPTSGLLYLASYLRRNNVTAYCKFNDINLDFPSLKKNLKHLLRTIQPRVVGVSMKWFTYMARVFEICKIVKEYCTREGSHDIKVVVGGNTASYYWMEVIRNEHVDVVIRGDGEVPFLKICQEADYLPNCVYKKNGEIIANPITYVQDKTNSAEIYLSHLDEILISTSAPLFGSFFIFTHKGCGMNCIYCAGCRKVQEKTFNRTRLFNRSVEEVRKDIMAAQKYTSTFVFDFDAPNERLLEYCKKIWQGIDLSSHFCIYVNITLPSPGLIDLINKTFKYVYCELDLASASQRHREQLASLGLVKPQPTDKEIFHFLDTCEKYDNNEVRINLINGLPYFTLEDIDHSEKTLTDIINSYSCVSNLHWARLHAQPGAPVVEDADKYDMYSMASTFEEFLKSSKRNFINKANFSNMDYPYIYFKDDQLNSKLSSHYSTTNLKLAEHRKNRRKLMVNEELSYQELNRKANQLAWKLREKGIQADHIVGLLMESSLEMAVGILGVLKSGGAFLPIDPESPGRRKTNMLKDSKVKVFLIQEHLLSQNNHPDLLQRFSLEHLVINDQTFHPGESADPDIEPHPDDLAYVIYTSGTTGEPRGILIRHRGIVNYTLWRLETYQYTPGDVTLQPLSYSFDGFGSNFYSSLLSGGTLFMVPDSRRLDLDYLKEAIKSNRVTNISLVPGMYQVLLESCESKELESMRFVVLAGEKSSPRLIRMSREKSPHVLLINEYGPTETTVTAAGRSNIDETDTAVLGKPIANTSIYIMDTQLQPVPVTVAGELCIAGPGTARGYLNNPALTAEKFVEFEVKVEAEEEEAPREQIPHMSYMSYMSYIYRTGDWARWMPDGNIEILGRKDQQVKIQGYRIEPGEIESVLSDFDGIKEAVVVTGEVKQEKYLCAYYVPRVNNRENRTHEMFNESQLKEYLARQLPGYMIPTHIIPVEGIPLTPNGKIDYKALPQPGTADSGKEYQSPRNQTEEKLAKIWAEVLGLKSKEHSSIGIDDNFFYLGGHSLRATLVATRIHKELHINIPLAEIFNYPTIRGLAGYIKDLDEVPLASLEPVEKKAFYVLSSAQKRLYFLQQMEQASIAYNIPLVLQFQQEPEKERLEKTFFKLIQRHESLRTSFALVENEPIQRIHDEVEFEIEYYDLYRNRVEVKVKDGDKEGTRGLAPLPIEPAARGSQPAAALISSFIRPFDLSRAPLVRIGLIRVEANKHIFMMDMHHITVDGISHQILVQDFTSLYNGEELPPLRIQYKDFSEWQKGDKEKEKIKQQENYWLQQFGTQGEIPVLALPTDFSRPAVQVFAGRLQRFEINETSTNLLKKVVPDRDTTLFVILVTLYYIFLAKISSQEDIVVGTPAAGRRYSDLEQVVGMFINTLPLRNFPNGEKTIEQFLEEVKNRTAAAFSNQDYPYEELVEKSVVTRDISRNPLFDTVITLQNMDNGEIATPGLNLESFNYDPGISKFDLTLHVNETEKNLQCTFEYNTKLFRDETIERFIRYFKNIVHSIPDNPGQQISRLEIIPEIEKHRILYEFNNLECEYPGDTTIHELFEKQAQTTPDNIALMEPQEKYRTHMTYMTYRELNEKSNQLAHILIERGIQPGTIVAIMMERSFEMIIGILGILKAGGAYLPIDPDYPQERINYMLADSSAKILLAEPDLTSAIEPSLSTSTCQVSPTNLAYIIYTSGTTGKPKGVLIEHGNVVRLMFNENFQFDFSDSDVWTLFHSFCFDFSVWEMYGALLYGGKLVVIPKMTARDSEGFLDLLKKQQVTILNQTPSAFYSLVKLEQKNPTRELGIRCVIFGGEALAPARLKEWKTAYPGARLINMYGITETTVHVTFKEISHREIETNASAIGKPIPTLSIYLIDKHLKLVPMGVVGELTVGGKGVGRGYLNRPELTAERFLSFFNKSYRSYMSYISPSSYIYRTGDLARWLPEEELEYLGRIDQQVKIRGFRIEPGEIENQLLKHNRIKEVVVVQGENQKQEKYLCAYIVMDMEQTIEIAELKNFLSKHLPDYMIPAYIMPIPSIPVTPNGKIDRKALPPPEIKPGEKYTAPRNDIEKTLAEIWAEILAIKKENISIDSNFFDLGGDSLKVISLVSRIHQTMNVRLSILDIFQSPSLVDLGKLLKAETGEVFVSIELAEKKEYYALSSAQRRLYIHQQFNLRSTIYNMPEITVWEDKLEKERLDNAFRKLIKRHESLRTSFRSLEGEPVQQIHHQVEFNIEYYKVESGVEVEKIVNNFIRPFDLCRAPLLRVGLIGNPGDRYILIADMHHIITDGISHRILRRDFETLYREEELTPLRIQYKDFSQWQNNEKVKAEIKQQENYWINEFKGSIPELALPLDYPRPPVLEFSGKSLEFILNSKETNALRKFAKEEEVTLFMTLLALFNILLSKISNQSDIIVGTAVSGRGHPDLDQVIGMFVNMLPLRNFPAAEKTFREFLQEIKIRTLEAYDNQNYPFEELVANLVRNRSADRTPIFNVVFAPQNATGKQNHPGNHEEQPTAAFYLLENKTTKYDLTLIYRENGDQLLFSFEYRNKLFKKETIKRFANYFKDIVSTVITTPLLHLQDISIDYHLADASGREFFNDFRF